MILVFLETIPYDTRFRWFFLTLDTFLCQRLLQISHNYCVIYIAFKCFNIRILMDISKRHTMNIGQQALLITTSIIVYQGDIEYVGYRYCHTSIWCYTYTKPCDTHSRCGSLIKNRHLMTR